MIPPEQAAVDVDRWLAVIVGDGVARLEHRVGVGVEVEVALRLLGVAPGDREHLLALGDRCSTMLRPGERSST